MLCTLCKVTATAIGLKPSQYMKVLTFRSFVIGTVVAGLGAALAEVSSWFMLTTSMSPRTTLQIYIYRPIDVSISAIFLLLFVFTIGKAWARFLPTGETFKHHSKLAWLAPIAHFVNPGPFGLKEVRRESVWSSRLC
jgi:OPT oligopeptide transporter protein